MAINGQAFTFNSGNIKIEDVFRKKKNYFFNKRRRKKTIGKECRLYLTRDCERELRSLELRANIVVNLSLNHLTSKQTCTLVRGH